jgi:hypothetical protein
MKRAKAIPKSLYQSDTSTIMNVLGILKQAERSAFSLKGRYLSMG